MPPRRPIWIDHGNPVFRRGLAACLDTAGYPIAGLSAGLQPRPDLTSTAVLLFGIDDVAVHRVAALVRGTGVRLVGLLGERSLDQLPDLRRAGLSAVLGTGALTPERLVACMEALEERSGPGAPGDGGTTLVGALPHLDQRLTPREFDVLRLLAEGATTRDIAQRMNYSERTVKNIIHDLLVKLRGRTRAHAVAVAARRGVI